MVNIYAPNMGQSTFLSKLNLLLAEFPDYSILMAGDFSLVSNAVVDSSGCPLPVDGSLLSALKELQQSFALIDLWRTVNPDIREYTFYSCVHSSYSRIDYILFSQHLVGNVIDCKIHPIILSEYAPLPALFVPNVMNSKVKHWRYNCIKGIRFCIYDWGKSFSVLILHWMSLFRLFGRPIRQLVEGGL